MYPSVRSKPAVADRRPMAPPVNAGAGRRSVLRRAATANVLVLGFTSLITDVSSEMVTAVVPLYLTAQIGLSVQSFGLFEGAYQASSALLRLWGGSLADRTSRHKEVATSGYALSAATRFGLVASVGTTISPVPFLLIDRLGKGIRTAPRDALISLSADRAVLATAFGIHRALDAFGAMAGPLLAFVVLDLAHGAFDAVFVVSAIIGVLGVLVIGLLARPVKVALTTTDRTRSMHRQIRSVWRIPGMARLAVAAGILSVLAVSDAFVYLVIQRETHLDARLFPLMFVGTALSYLVLALPLGRLADRIGRRQVFLAGHGPLVAVYLLLLYVELSTTTVLACLVLLGTYWAATDGVITAMASALVPDRHRGAGIATVTVSVALGRLISSAVFGALWSFQGLDFTLMAFAVGLVISVPVGAVVLRGAGPRSVKEEQP